MSGGGAEGGGGRKSESGRGGGDWRTRGGEEMEVNRETETKEMAHW